MQQHQPRQSRWLNWLETRWVAPSYAGGLMLGLSLFFFAAATNTMAGWLYVISGGMMAILAIAAIMPPRSLRQISIRRSPIHPISAGDALRVELIVQNPTARHRTLLEVADQIPFVIGKPQTAPIETLPPLSHHSISYSLDVEKRGLYRWQTVYLRTAAPFGLFWRRQTHELPALAVVYPQVLPLANCPIVDELGRDRHAQLQSMQQPLNANQGMTRALRPYRWGDPIRLVHWRTTARYGELRVRELEVITGGQALVIALDSAIAWAPDDFESAVTTAASLFFYALRQNLQVSIWTAGAGLIQGQQRVLEALAAVHFDEEPTAGDRPPDLPLVWLTGQADRLRELPMGSRWVLWGGSDRGAVSAPSPGLIMQPDDPLPVQLQRSPQLRAAS